MNQVPQRLLLPQTRDWYSFQLMILGFLQGLKVGATYDGSSVTLLSTSGWCFGRGDFVPCRATSRVSILASTRDYDSGVTGGDSKLQNGSSSWRRFLLLAEPLVRTLTTLVKRGF